MLFHNINLILAPNYNVFHGDTCIQNYKLLCFAYCNVFLHHLPADRKSDSTVYVLSGALAVFTSFLVVVLAYSVVKIYKRDKCHCKGKSWHFFSVLNNQQCLFILVYKLLFGFYFETGSQIVLASDITPEAVSIIDSVFSNSLKYFFWHKLCETIIYHLSKIAI